MSTGAKTKDVPSASTSCSLS